ncbi:MAG: ABC transporter permease subunit [bacterium]|nr:ABC transporter permease subunit [bacterium]
MKSYLRNAWLIAKTIGIEAIRRKEIYAIVLVSLVLIGGLRLVKFFDVEGLGKFYREISLKVMNVATALTVILLAARQLPREFQNRTLYPLLAKPIRRDNFLMGKFLGVMLAAAFCYAMFMAVFLFGSLTIKSPVNTGLFLQFVYLQLWNFAVLGGLAFLLSLLLNIDAAITICILLYVFSQVLMTLMSYIYDYTSAWQQTFLLGLHFVIPQLSLFDLSGKVVHGIWPPIASWAILALTAYGAVYTVLYLSGSYLLFRRRAL